MTITLEEFDALPADVRQKYLRAAHGVAVRTNNYLGCEENPSGILCGCVKDLRDIRRQAKGLDVKDPS